ncbi:n-terminal region (domain i and ii) domain-containing protein [Cystoisospora suis]|uniref:molybdopterin adenylyltransferase n=1 Tax=Cystoisospora suis TaxID=483139 RepID=A0A2C6KNU5_9APIC|nr:n-terminal region (domain i and ii) domain-containing protein [Cystoisospora suis]
MKNRSKKKKNPPPHPHATTTSSGGFPTMPENSSTSGVCTPSDSATIPLPRSTIRTTPTTTTTTKLDEKGEHSLSSPRVFSHPITSCPSPPSSSPVSCSAAGVSSNSEGIPMKSKDAHEEASCLSRWVREESPFEMLELTDAQEIIDGEIRRLIHTYLHSFNLQRGTAKIHISPSSSFSSTYSSTLPSSSSSSFHEDDRGDTEASCCYQSTKDFLLSEVIAPPYRGRRPVRSVVAPHPLPSFRASIVDGYAVQPQVYRHHHHPHRPKKGGVPSLESKKRDLPSSKELPSKPTAHETSHEKQANESLEQHRDLTKKTSPSSPTTATGKEEEHTSSSSLHHPPHKSSQSSSSPSSMSIGPDPEKSIVLRIVGEVRAGSSDMKDFRHVHPRQSIEGIDTDRKPKASDMVRENRQGGQIHEREVVKKGEASAEGLGMRKNEKNKEKKAIEKEEDHTDKASSIAPNFPTCVYVTTGARVPDKYTAVIPVEDCKVDFDRSLCVPDERVWSSLRQGENIRPIGSDVPRGLPLVDSGQSIGPAEEGLLASFDIQSLEVYRHLNVHVLAIGDELISRSVSSSSLDNQNRQIRQTKTEKEDSRRKIEHAVLCEKTATSSSQSASDSPSDGELSSRHPFGTTMPSSSSPTTNTTACQEKTRDVVYDSNTPTIGGLIAERCRGVSIGSNHLLPDEAEAVERLLISLATGGGKEISMSSGESSSHKIGDASSTPCLHDQSHESTQSILLKCPCQWCEEMNSSHITGSPKKCPSPSSSCRSASASSSETKEPCAFSNQMMKKKTSLPPPDVLISTGGVSMGAESDCVKLALLNLERRSKVHASMKKEETTSESETKIEKKGSLTSSSLCDLIDSSLMVNEGLFATCPSGCCRLKIEVDIHLGRLNVKPGKPAMFATVKVFSVRQDSNDVEGHLSLSDEKQDRVHHEKMKCTQQSPLSSSSSSSISSTLLRTLLVFALPGNPCSSWVLFHLLIEPALNFFSSFLPSSSLFSYTPPHLPVVLASPVYPDSTRPEYQRALVYVTPPSFKSQDKAARSHTTYMPSSNKTLDQHGDTSQILSQHRSPSQKVSTQISTLSCVDVVCFDGLVKKQDDKGDITKSVTTMTCCLSSVNGTWKEEKKEDEKPYLTAYPTGPFQQSSRLLSCCVANSLLLIPPRKASGKDAYEAGEVVEAYLLHVPYSSPPRHLLNFLRLQNQLQGQHSSTHTSGSSSSISSRTPQGLNLVKVAINTRGCRCGKNDDDIDRSRDGVRQVIHKEEKSSCKLSNGGAAVELQKKKEEDYRISTHVMEQPTVGGMRGKEEKGRNEVVKKELFSVVHEECSVRVDGVHTPHQVDDKMKQRPRNAEGHPHPHHPHSHHRHNEKSSFPTGDVKLSSATLSTPSSLECRESLLCRLAIIVVSDRCSRGEMKDECVKTVYTTLQRVPKVYNLLLPASSSSFSPSGPAPKASSPRDEGSPKDWLVVPDDVLSIRKALLSFLCPCRSEGSILKNTSYTFSAHRDDPHESGERSNPNNGQTGSSLSVCEDSSSLETSPHHLQRKSLIIVCGGTGLAVRDVTPQALLPFLSVRCTGLEHLILQHSLKCTPLAALGRPCVGVATCPTSRSSQEAGDQSDSAYIVNQRRHMSDDGSTEESSLASDGDVTKKEALLQTGHVSPTMERHSQVETTKDKTGLLSEKNITDDEGVKVERGEEAVAESRCHDTSTAGGCGARALVLILPGSPKAVRECLEALVDVLPHALELL